MLYIGIIKDPNRACKIFSSILYPFTRNDVCIRVIFSKRPLVTGSCGMCIKWQTTQSQPRRVCFSRGLNYWFWGGRFDGVAPGAAFLWGSQKFPWCVSVVPPAALTAPASVAPPLSWVSFSPEPLLLGLLSSQCVYVVQGALAWILSLLLVCGFQFSQHRFW